MSSQEKPVMPEAIAAPFHFSDEELLRRRSALEEVMDQAGTSHLLLYGANRAGSSVPWLTDWPVTREAHLVVRPGETSQLLINFYNHVPQAQRIARFCDARWAGANPIETVLGLLPAHGRVGVIGPLPHDQFARIAQSHEIVQLDREYVGLRQRKSAEEVLALRQAADLTDLAAHALVSDEVIGLTEHEAIARIESAYVARGGNHHIHYVGVTAMSAPDRCVPAQWPSGRRIRPGDLMTFELSAASAPDYPGQLLRSVTVGSDASPVITELHDAATAAFDAIFAALRPGVLSTELIAAAGVIESAGFTTLDDLVHGFGGGYLPPVFGSASRELQPPPSNPIEAGMTLVIQPNVVLPDRSLGVQTGELVLVTERGAERLHTFPQGLLRIG